MQTKPFEAEVSSLLQLMINSVYANKDACIRELISNAVDACSKLFYLSQVDTSLSDKYRDARIDIELDRHAKIIRIFDNGIGMDCADLESCLGKIAGSGTRKFVEALTNAPDLIGQFGVGFYSAFIIASKVEIKTRKFGQSQSYIWSSVGLNSYEIGELEEDVIGTQVTLYLKPGEENYLDSSYIRDLIVRYANYVLVPIFLKSQESDVVQVNTAKAIWHFNKTLLARSDYDEFYKSISRSSDSPWIVLHNFNEGSNSFTNLLFIPSERTLDIFSGERRRLVKLYIKRTFIGDEDLDLIPYYLRFLRGVVEGNSLPLNLNREAIQKSAAIARIRSVIVTRVLGELKAQLNSDFNSYEKFWHNFGSILKEGICEDSSSSTKILDLCLFYSCLSKRLITLREYLNYSSSRVIYYFNCESTKEALNSPQLEGFLHSGLDVLLMTDMVDSFWLNMVGEYEGAKFCSVTTAGISPVGPRANLSEEPLCEYFKQCLGNLVSDVRISQKLTDSPACIATEEGRMDPRMERFLLAQNHIRELSPRILEINPQHSIVALIDQKLKSGQCDERTKETAILLFEQASLIDGCLPQDAVAFCKRINSLIFAAKDE